MSRRVPASVPRRECGAGWASQLLLWPRVEAGGAEGAPREQTVPQFTDMAWTGQGIIVRKIVENFTAFEFLFGDSVQNLRDSSLYFELYMKPSVMEALAAGAFFPREELLAIFGKLSEDTTPPYDISTALAPVDPDQREEAKNFETTMLKLLMNVRVVNWTESGTSLFFSFWQEYYRAVIAPNLSLSVYAAIPEFPAGQGPRLRNLTLNYQALRMMCLFVENEEEEEEEDASSFDPGFIEEHNSLELHEFVSLLPGYFIRSETTWPALYAPPTPAVPRPGLLSPRRDAREPVFIDLHDLIAELDGRHPEPVEPWPGSQRSMPRVRHDFKFGKGFLYGIKLGYILEELQPRNWSSSIRALPNPVPTSQMQAFRGFAFTSGCLTYSREHKTHEMLNEENVREEIVKPYHAVKLRLKGSYVWTVDGSEATEFDLEADEVDHRPDSAYLRNLREQDVFVEMFSNINWKESAAAKAANARPYPCDVGVYSYNDFNAACLGQAAPHFEFEDKHWSRKNFTCAAMMFAEDFTSIEPDDLSKFNGDSSVWSVVTPLYALLSVPVDWLLTHEDSRVRASIPIKVLTNTFLRAQIDLDIAGGLDPEDLVSEYYTYFEFLPAGQVESYAGSGSSGGTRAPMTEAEARFGTEALPVLAELLQQISVSGWEGSGWPFFFGLWLQYCELRKLTAREELIGAAERAQVNYRAFQDMLEWACPGGKSEAETVTSEKLRRFVTRMPKHVVCGTGPVAPLGSVGGLQLSEVLRGYLGRHANIRPGDTATKSIGPAGFKGGFMYFQNVPRATEERAEELLGPVQPAVRHEFPLRDVVKGVGLFSTYLTFSGLDLTFRRNIGSVETMGREPQAGETVHELSFALTNCFVWGDAMAKDPNSTELEEVDVEVTYREFFTATGAVKLDQLGRPTVRARVPRPGGGFQTLFEFPEPTPPDPRTVSTHRLLLEAVIFTGTEGLW